MLEKINKVQIFSFILFLTICTLAQDINRMSIDEKSGKPMLIGYCNRIAFNDTSFAWWYNSNYQTYSLDQDTVKLLKATLNSYNILTILGTWCSDSKREIPRLYKILDSTNYDFSKLKLISVGRDMRDITGEVSALDVKFVPTIIFYKNGIELGRIVESAQGTLEGDIFRIINKDLTRNN